MATPETHPMQTQNVRRGGRIPKAVALLAYEVYCHINSPQEAMVTGGCRGGFGTSEIIGFLYAHSFPKDEWKRRAIEAWEGMEKLD